jgi:hypothetical protein
VVDPELSDPHRFVRDHLEEFLRWAEEHFAKPLPRYVGREPLGNIVGMVVPVPFCRQRPQRNADGAAKIAQRPPWHGRAHAILPPEASAKRRRRCQDRARGRLGVVMPVPLVARGLRETPTALPRSRKGLFGHCRGAVKVQQRGRRHEIGAARAPLARTVMQTRPPRRTSSSSRC